MSLRQTFSRYYWLAKPGIVYGNTIAFVAGYFAYASTLSINFYDFLLALVGVALVMGSSCVANNMYDRDIDGKMARTKRRALVVDDISLRHALIYAAVLLVTGVALLFVSSGIVGALLGVVGWIMYAIVYTRAKRRTRHATLIGTIPGAIPPVIGYVAAGGSIDIVAALLFIAMVGWQMVHFFAIALFRKSDYKAAGIPVMPIATSDQHTILEMKLYAVLFVVSAIALGYWFGMIYTILTVLLCLWMLNKLYTKHTDTTTWGRNQFKTSLLVLLIWSAIVVVAAVL